MLITNDRISQVDRDEANTMFCWTKQLNVFPKMSCLWVSGPDRLMKNQLSGYRLHCSAGCVSSSVGTHPSRLSLSLSVNLCRPRGNSLNRPFLSQSQQHLHRDLLRSVSGNRQPIISAGPGTICNSNSCVLRRCPPPLPRVVNGTEDNLKSLSALCLTRSRFLLPRVVRGDSSAELAGSGSAALSGTSILFAAFFSLSWPASGPGPLSLPLLLQFGPALAQFSIKTPNLNGAFKPRPAPPPPLPLSPPRSPWK